MKRKDTVLVGSSMRWTPQTTVDNHVSTSSLQIKSLKRPSTTVSSNSSPLKRIRSMDDTQKFTNTSCLAQSLVRLFNNPELSDIVVRVGHERFHLHKMLLMRSEVFRIMMLGKDWADAKLPEIVLEEGDQCIPHMGEFFQYFYSGEIKLSSANVMPLMILSNKYQVTDLEQACEQHACALVFSGLSTELIISWWQVANQLCCRNLFRKCKEYIILNADPVIACDSFAEFTLEEVESLLLERDLVVSSEYGFYLGLQKWLNHKSRIEDYTENLSFLIPHIKFCMMTMSELADLEKNLALNPKGAGLLLPKLIEAYKYHATPFAIRRTNGLSTLDNPRLYTGSKDKHFSTCHTIRLHPEERRQIISGLSEKVDIPISTSEADRNNTKSWCMAFREADNILNVEVSSTLGADEDFSLVESSFLIYKYANSRTFVKGVMQMRCCVKSLPYGGKAGHVFSMVVPAESLEAESTYQIKSGNESYCMFKLVMRHYQEDFVREQMIRLKAIYDKRNATRIAS